MLSASVLAAMSVSCSVEGPQEMLPEQKVPQVTADVLEGQLLVRFDARVSDILDKAGLTKSGPMAPMTRSGVLSVDEILDLVDGILRSFITSAALISIFVSFFIR